MAFGLKEIRKTRVYQEAREEGEQIGEERGKLQGEQIGEERGKLQGELEGKLEVAQNLLRMGVTPQVIVQATGLTLEAVEKLQH